MKQGYEVNLNAIVGPTHSFSGLSYGNEASFESFNEISKPKEAALQSLMLMKFLMDKGIKQIVVPPHERPYVPILKRMGFKGKTDYIFDEAKRHAPWIFRYISSASPMWMANAATITPSIDSANNRVQITPANLHSKFHRSIESTTTGQILKKIFPNPVFFEHHSPLPSHEIFGDEGAANHIRFGKTHSGPGVHLFAYGNTRISNDELVPLVYPARQSREATEALIQLHKVFDKQALKVQQNPKAIDAGVFHNDVICTGNLNLFLYHQHSFVQTTEAIRQLEEKVQAYADTSLHLIRIPDEDISLQQAVKSYLFNSQIVSAPDGSMIMLAPVECQQDPAIMAYLKSMLENEDNPITEIIYVDLTQSMKNGGGPACLRLRVPLNENEFNEVHPGVILTDELYTTLVAWVNKHYRTTLHPDQLSDLEFYQQNQIALDELTKILEIGSIYSFQK